MIKPNAYHGTAAEIAFMRALGPRGRFSRLQMLQRYRAACEQRVAWNGIDRHEVLKTTDREIEAVIRTAGRKAA